MKKLLLFILSIIILIPALLPLFRNGFFVIHDNTQVERVSQMSKALSEGNFPVRWVEDLGYGYGYPIFNFYAPLPYYIGGFFELVVNDAIVATKLMFAIGTIISFFSMYLLASALTNKYAGFLAGVIYLYFPYHALNIYVRGAVGEFFAYAFIPLVFWGIYYIFKKIKIQKRSRVLLTESIFLSIPLALVTISHNLSAFMLGLFMAPYILFFLIKVKNKKPYIYSIAILCATAFMLSAFYVLPAIFESQFTNVRSQIGGGADYPDHFVCIVQLWSSNWGFGGSAPGCIDGISFALGKINILILVFAFAFFAKDLVLHRKKTHESIFWILLGMSIFLLLPISQIFWDTFPFMEYLQFPWRFLNFVGLFIGLIGAFVMYKLKKNYLALISILIIIVVTIYSNVNLFSPVVFTDYDSNYYENRDHIRWETSKISDEYMPRDFDKPLAQDNLPEELVAASVGVSIDNVTSRTGFIEIKKSGNSGVIHINKAYFPAWEGSIDGKNIDITKSNTGMYIQVPEGEKEITLRIGSTPIQVIGNTLTIIGIVAVIVAIIAKKKKLYE